MKKIVVVLSLSLLSMVSFAQEIKWMTMNEALEAQKKDPKPIFMDVYTNWCGPCKMMEPLVKQLAEDMEGEIAVAKIDIESSQQTTAEYHVTSIPTMIVFKDGSEVDRIVGVKDLESLKSLVKKHV